MNEQVECPYCHTQAVCRSSEIIYGSGRYYGKVWVCSNYPSCDAYVGCHGDSDDPLGTLANRQLRELRKAAHAQFDELWKSGRILVIYQRFMPGVNARRRAYTWLAEQMFLTLEETHFAMMDKPQIEKAIRIIKQAKARTE